MMTRRGFLSLATGGSASLALALTGCESDTKRGAVSAGTQSQVDPAGWLPYGSTDPSVLFSHPLTFAPTNITIPCANLTTAGEGVIEHDAVRGVRSNGRCYNIVGLANADKILEHGGQISFEVETTWLATHDASGTASGSEGAFTNQFQSALSFQTTSGHLTNYPQRFGNDATGITGLVHSIACGNLNYYTGAANGPPCAHTTGKDDFVRVNIGFLGGPNGGRMVVAVDDVLLVYHNMSAAGVSGFGANWWIGSDRGVANTFVNSRYIRNLQISTRPPTFAVLPTLQNLVLWGDSMVKDLNAAHFTGHPYYDTASGLSMARVLMSRDIYPGSIIALSHGGHTIINQGSNQLQTHRAAMLANDPTCVIMRGGTNDAGFTGFQGTFQTDLRDHISTIMAHWSVEMMIVANVPTRKYLAGSEKANEVAWINSEMATLEAWWSFAGAATAGVPEKADRLKVIDTYNYLGAENPSAKTYIGQLTGLYNDVHYSSNGHYMQGRQYGEAILELLK